MVPNWSKWFQMVLNSPKWASRYALRPCFSINRKLKYWIWRYITGNVLIFHTKIYFSENFICSRTSKYCNIENFLSFIFKMFKNILISYISLHLILTYAAIILQNSFKNHRKYIFGIIWTQLLPNYKYILDLKGLMR